jgi:hypothetical protein
VSRRSWARAALSHSAFTGISRHHLGRLAAELAGPGQARRDSALRQRRGADRRHDLVFTDRVLVTLAVLRLQIPHAALAAMHGADRSTVTRAVAEIRPLLAGRGYATPQGQRLRTLARTGSGILAIAASTTSPGTFPPHTATAVWVCLELVEAAMRTGRKGEAAVHVAAMREVGLAAISSRLDFIVWACAALAAGDDGAGPFFESALGLPGVRRRGRRSLAATKFSPKRAITSHARAGSGMTGRRVRARMITAESPAAARLAGRMPPILTACLCDFVMWSLTLMICRGSRGSGRRHWAGPVRA